MIRLLKTLSNDHERGHRKWLTRVALRRTIHITLNKRSKLTNSINLLEVLDGRWVTLNVKIFKYAEFMKEGEYLTFRATRRLKMRFLITIISLLKFA